MPSMDLFYRVRLWAVCCLVMGSVYGQHFSTAEYADVNNKSVYFFGAQRSGNTHNWLTQQHSGSKVSFVKDGLALGRDLSGGWHDAGDFIKFTLTIASSSYGLLKSYDAWPLSFSDEYDFDHNAGANGIPDVLDQVKVATDYLIKTYLNQDSVVSRVGGDQDHSHWTTSPMMSSYTTAKGGGSRPVYFETKGDIAGKAAASLALMSRLYRPFSPSYADSAFDIAEKMFDYALAHRGITPEPGENYYQDSHDKDDILCGATELYAADERGPRSSEFLDSARSFDNQTGVHYWVVDWANSSDYCRHTLVKLGVTQAQSKWKSAVDSYIDQVSQEQYVKGLMYLNVDWGTSRYAVHAAFSAALYYDLIGGEQYKEFAYSQLDYVMGLNEYNRSLIVGYGINPPTRPHHKNSYGRDVPDWNFDKEPLYELTGALVGGPSVGDASGNTTPGYSDILTDYVSNEVSIDYNVGLVGVSAYAVNLDAPTHAILDSKNKQGSLEFKWDKSSLSLSGDLRFLVGRLGSSIDLIQANGQLIQKLELSNSFHEHQNWKLEDLASGQYRVIWGPYSESFTIP